MAISIVMKTVLYTSTARQALLALSAPVQVRVKAKVARYAETGAGDVTRLQGSDASRLRVGDYRVIFVETVEEIEVRAVGHRSQIYR